MKLISRNRQLTSQQFSAEDLQSKYYLLSHLAGPFTHQESASIQKALRLLGHAYSDNSRELRSIHVDHSFEVACLLATKFTSATQAMISALLHEVIAVGKVSLATIECEFGTDISIIVASVNQLAKAAYLGKAVLLASLRKLLSKPMPHHIQILLVSMADCLENLYRLASFLPNEQQQWAKLAQRVYAPLANRIGIYHVQSELEDLQLKFSKRTIYDKIVKHIETDRSTTEGFLASFITPIHLALQQRGLTHTIQARTKSIYSIYQKMLARRVSLEAINDLYAIRIVFDGRWYTEHTTCWLIYELVKTLYEPLPHKLKSWLSYPKDSGYEALHFAVMSQAGQVVEVQIRSTRMDAIAEEGEAAHWKYKGPVIPKELAVAEGLWRRKARQFLRTSSVDKTIQITTSSLYIKQ